MLLGTADAETAFQVVHAGAIYLHRGETYESSAWTWRRAPRTCAGGAPLLPTPRVSTAIRVVEQHADRPVGEAHAGFGEVFGDDQGAWLPQAPAGHGAGAGADRPGPARADLPHGRPLDRAFACGSAAAGGRRTRPPRRCTRSSTPRSRSSLVAMCDRWDAGGASHPNHPDLFLLPSSSTTPVRRGGDRRPLLPGPRPVLLQQTLATVSNCACEAGCPRASTRRPAAAGTSRSISKGPSTCCACSSMRPGSKPSGRQSRFADLLNGDDRATVAPRGLPRRGRACRDRRSQSVVWRGFLACSLHRNCGPNAWNRARTRHCPAGCRRTACRLRLLRACSVVRLRRNLGPLLLAQLAPTWAPGSPSGEWTTGHRHPQADTRPRRRPDPPRRAAGRPRSWPATGWVTCSSAAMPRARSSGSRSTACSSG